MPREPANRPGRRAALRAADGYAGAGIRTTVSRVWFGFPRPHTRRPPAEGRPRRTAPFASVPSCLRVRIVPCPPYPPCPPSRFLRTLPTLYERTHLPDRPRVRAARRPSRRRQRRALCREGEPAQARAGGVYPSQVNLSRPMDAHVENTTP